MVTVTNLVLPGQSVALTSLMFDLLLGQPGPCLAWGRIVIEEGRRTGERSPGVATARQKSQ